MPGQCRSVNPVTRRSPRLLTLALAATIALLAAACSSEESDTAAASDDTTTTAAPSTTAAPTPEELAAELESPGGYAVGKTSVEVTGARGRVLPVDVWYPADPGDATGATPAAYPFPGLEVPSETALADVPVAEGPFPLVVYSHGNGGLRYVSAFLTEHLASHGFVVMAPDHVGNTAIDAFAGTSTDRAQVALDRPADVSAVIDAVLAGGPGLQDVTPQVDAEEIGVIGHSFGGLTALTMASGFGEVPADERVDAVVGMAAASMALDDAALAAIDVPTLLLSGTADETVPVAENTERPWELVRGRPLVRADVADAGHQSFTDVCSYQDQLAAMPEAPPVLVEAVDEYAMQGCTPELIDIDEAHRIIRRVTTAFLLEELDGQTQFATLLEGPPEDPTLAVLDERS